MRQRTIRRNLARRERMYRDDHKFANLVQYLPPSEWPMAPRRWKARLIYVPGTV